MSSLRRWNELELFSDGRIEKTGEYKDTFYYRCHHRKKVDGKICDYKPMLEPENV